MSPRDDFRALRLIGRAHRRAETGDTSFPSTVYKKAHIRGSQIAPKPLPMAYPLKRKTEIHRERGHDCLCKKGSAFLVAPLSELIGTCVLEPQIYELASRKPNPGMLV